MAISANVWNDLEGEQNNKGNKYQDMFSMDVFNDFYHGNIIRMDMNDWLEEEQQIKPCSK